MDTASIANRVDKILVKMWLRARFRAMLAQSRPAGTVETTAMMEDGALRSPPRRAGTVPSDYVAANRELIADQKAYDDASTPVLDKVHSSSAYVAAKDQSDQSQTALADLRANGGSDDEIAAKSADAMQAGSAVHKLESAALGADAATVAAQAKQLYRCRRRREKHPP